jgi:hypothetical protein
MENLINFLRIDIREKYAVLRNEIQTSYITLSYLNNLGIAKESGFFQQTYDNITRLKDNIEEMGKEIDLKNKNNRKPNDYIWHFLNQRSTVIKKFQIFIDILGVIQKSLSQRLDSLPHLYPYPPTLRQKEIHKALKIYDEISKAYYIRLSKLYGEKINGEETILPVWDYMVDDKMMLNSNYTEKNRQDNPINILIKMTYWIVLLPNYMPILAHEISHAFVNKLNEKPSDRFNLNKISGQIASVMRTIFPFLTFNNLSRDLPREITSDFCSILIAGPTYVFCISSYLLRDKINYDKSNHMKGYSFLRLRLMVKFALDIIKKKKIKNPAFTDLLKTLNKLCGDYYDLLSNVDSAISSGVLSATPTIHMDCELKCYIDEFIYNLIYSNFKEKINDFINKIEWHFDGNKINKIISLFDTNNSIFFKSLKKNNLTECTNIPDVLWQSIIQTSNDRGYKDRFRTGHYNQELFRVLMEKSENKIALENNSILPLIKKSPFSLGKILDFLFLKVNWSCFKDDLLTPISNFQKNLQSTYVKNNNLEFIIFFHCIGTYDFLIVSDYTVKKGIEYSWPPDWALEPDASSDEKENDIFYFPRSEVFQEIKLDKNFLGKEQPNFKDFIDTAQCYCLYQINLDTSNRGITSRLNHAIKNTIKKYNELKIEEPNLDIFLLKSLGWEDLIIVFKNFKSLYSLQIIKDAFSDLLSHSLTTFFYKKDPDFFSDQEGKLSDSQVSTFVKVYNVR